MKLDRIKKQYSNKRIRTRMPALQPEPIVPTSQASLKQSQVASSKASKRKQDRTSMPLQQAIPDSTRSQACARPKRPLYPRPSHARSPTISVSGEDLTKVKNDLKQFKDMISDLKSAVAGLRTLLTADHLYKTMFASNTQDPVSNMILPEAGGPIENNLPKKDAEPTSKPFESIKPVRYGLIKHNPNRSNVRELPPTVNVAQVNISTSSPETEHGGDQTGEMVPIGSGKTLVPKSVYVTINWESYTKATRKLLMAVFPRRILATHSLTGKASPAFTNRPAKLCLDPKKVSDVAMEVTKKCKIKETLVRSVITTKCGDEYKMFRMQCD